MENYILTNNSVHHEDVFAKNDRHALENKTKTGDKVLSRCVLHEDNFAIVLWCTHCTEQGGYK